MHYGRNKTSWFGMFVTALAIVGLVSMLPDLKRYLRISLMSAGGLRHRLAEAKPAPPGRCPEIPV